MTSQKSTNAAQANFYNRFFEYARAVTDVVVTEEGVFQKDQVPDDYGGSRLEMETVNAVFLINSKAELQVFEFENPPIMDSERKTGGPIKRDDVAIRAATGDSSVDVAQRLVINPNLDPTRKAMGAAALSALRQAIESYGDEVPS